MKPTLIISSLALLATMLASVLSNDQQDSPTNNNRPFDLLIEGPGFFQVYDENTGEILYTRAGNFSINADGAIVHSWLEIERRIEPEIVIPDDATAVEVRADGVIAVRKPGVPKMVAAGQIELADFANPEHLLPMGKDLYGETGASGFACNAHPLTHGMGTVRAANVDPVWRMIDLIANLRR